MGHHLRGGPVHVARIAERQAVRRQPRWRAWRRYSSSTSRSQVQRARGLVGRVEQIAAGVPDRRPGAAAVRCGTAPAPPASPSSRRWMVREVLAEEGAERLVFPGLDVASGPVVQQAVTRRYGRRPGRSGWARRGVAGADPDAELQLEIQPAGTARSGGRSASAGFAARRAAGSTPPIGRTEEARP